MKKNIRLFFIITILTCFGMFAFAEETTVTNVTADDGQTVEIESDAPVESTQTKDVTQTQTETKKTETAANDEKTDRQKAKEERVAKKNEKLDRYQEKLFKKFSISVEGYTPAAAIPVVDMYRRRMLGSGAACITTGSLMFICAPLMMSLGGYFAFDDTKGGSVVKFEGNTITFIDENKDMLPTFIAGTVVFSMGAAFGIMSLIITPLCSVYFSKAHKSRLVLKRLKGLSMLQGLDVNYSNDGDHERLGLSMGFKI